MIMGLAVFVVGEEFGVSEEPALEEEVTKETAPVAALVILVVALDADNVVEELGD
jgi:hypothetical protein